MTPENITCIWFLFLGIMIGILIGMYINRFKKNKSLKSERGKKE